MDNRKLRFIKMIIFGIMLGYVVSFLVPFFLDIILLTILLIYVFHKDRAIIIGSIIGYSFRCMMVFIILLFFIKCPHHLNYKFKYPIKYILLLGSDNGLYEGIVRHYCNIIKKGDPYSNKPFMVINGNIYSVGPDCNDDKLVIIYDPTNGTISLGDIIVPIEK